MPPTRPARTLALLFLAALSAAPARAGTMPPDHGFQWATITHPGNAPYVQDRGPELPPLLYGGVDHIYRISKTEVAAREWLEFANAFVPLGDPFEIGRQVDSTTIDTIWGPGAVPAGFVPRNVAEPERLAVRELSWFNAARYCNWLHNNKEVSIAALQYGAYDLRGFTGGVDEVLAGPQPRLPGATFFLPSKDEWVKAVHFDPDRYGENQPGYWQYPHSSDTAPVPGPPGAGQTNTGVNASDYPLSFRVGAYPDTVTPWGLLDASGGVSEWLEGRQSFGSGGMIAGSSWIGSAPFGAPELDQVDQFGAAPSFGGHYIGFRIASSVPSSGVSILLLCGVGAFSFVRTRRLP